MEAPSRVFVSGLPPTLANEQLRKHFSSKFEVTDAHIIPNRRIGFVGFASHEQAKDAVAYYNKTFIRMSRITAELARPIHLDQTGQGEIRPMSQRHSTKSSNQLKEPLLQNDLVAASLTTTPKRQRESSCSADHDDFASPHYVSVPTADSRDSPGPDVKRQKQAATFSVPLTSMHNERAALLEPSNQHAEEIIDPIARDSAIKVTGQGVGMEDSEWLRSKTSRLLGLIDETSEEAGVLNTALPLKISPLRGASYSDDTHHKIALEVGSSNPSRSYHSVTSPEDTSQGHVDSSRGKILSNGRLFIRNLAHSVNQDDLAALFGNFGKLDEVHIATDTRSSTSRGYAYVQFAEAEAAFRAYQELDGTAFLGRLLHILPAVSRHTSRLDEYQLAKLPLKKQRQIKRRQEATVASFAWNSLFMNATAVMESVADRLGVAKSDILDPTSSDTAVKQAHAETHIIQETKTYFANNGVDLDAFKRVERGDRAILVKNFSYNVKEAALRNLFETYGNVTRFLMPPSGTIAIIEFADAEHARKAFQALAYRKFGDSILFLEKAPKDLFNGNSPEVDNMVRNREHHDPSTDLPQASGKHEQVETSTLFVRNLSFETSSTKLADAFKPLEGFLSARVKTKTDPKRPGQTLSMGFGFVEFKTKEHTQAALATMNGFSLDGHNLLVQPSHKGADAAHDRRREDNTKKTSSRRTKIIVKNLPFEATKKDLRSLFGSYGQLRSIRLPQKFDSSSRGFAFADFVTAREAENAMNSLKNTHLLGRRLALDFAAAEETDPEAEIRKIEKKVGEQMEKVRMKQLTGSGRRKFNVQDTEDGDA